jgi:hypothetical protein
VRTKTFGVALSLVLLSGSIVACDAIIGIEELRSNPSDDDGPGRECEVPSDCPAAGNACVLRECKGGLCSLTEAPAGTPVLSQESGDCVVVICGQDGVAVDQPDDADVLIDGNDCTQDLCAAGAPSNPVVPQGSPCLEGAGVCNGSMCVECLTSAQCSGGYTCDPMTNVCVPASCTNQVQDGSETDVDCGGHRCGPCGVGDTCQEGSDCTSKVCSGSPKVCQPPTCDDGVKNAQETAQDCGGPQCPDCGDGLACMSPQDCISKVCSCGGIMPCNDPVCQVPTCTDGVQNGGEVAPDCQGNCEGTCDVGEPCEGHEDCGSQNCVMNICQPAG